MIKTFCRSMVLLVLAQMALWPEIAWAYLDGGVGSMLLQLLAGGIAGIAVIGKLYLYKIKSYWQRFRTKRKSEDQ